MQQKTKKLPVFVFIVLTTAMTIGIFLANGYFFQKKLPTTPENLTDQMKNQMETVEPASDTSFADDWATLTNNSLGHSFKHPKNAKAEARETESLVSFMGEIQTASGRTQTELFDGYIFRVGEIELLDDTTIQDLAQTQKMKAESECNSDTGKISPVQTVKITDSLSVLQYTVRGCRTDYTESFGTIGAQSFMITQMYVGTPEDQANYQIITDQMLTTFRPL